MNVLQNVLSSLGPKTFLSFNAFANATNMLKRMATLDTLHLRRMKKLENPELFTKKKKSPLNGKPFAKGIILKTLIKKPRKPNSANRKCVLVKLTTGREMIAFVPGIGHNLQEHQTVLCTVGRIRDTPGVKIRCVRGKYDLPHVLKHT